MVAAIFSCFVTPVTSVEAIFSCGTVTGDGSQADPWRIWTDQDLACFDPSVTWTPGGVGTDSYVVLESDLTWNSNLPLFAPTSAATTFHLDGQGHGITISNVVSFQGLLGVTNNVEVSNLIIRSDNSTLDIGAGWLSLDDTSGTYSGIAVYADVSPSSGGIVGAFSSGTMITKSYSTGIISDMGGGLAGVSSSSITISSSFSTGLIGQGAGGLIGSNSSNVSVVRSFSTGLISNEGGGLVGSNTNNVLVSNSYSTGSVQNDAGGLVGANSSSATITNSYTTGLVSGVQNDYVGTGAFNALISNSDHDTLAWSDVSAQSALAEVGSQWKTCGLNVPFYIAAQYPDDICSTAASRAKSISFDGSSFVKSGIPANVGDILSIENTGNDGPASYIEVLNGSAHVLLGGIACTGVSLCRLPDSTQGLPARRDLTVVDAGTVTIRRYDARVGQSGVVSETFTIAADSNVTNSTTLPPGTTPSLPATGAESGISIWGLLALLCGVSVVLLAGRLERSRR